MQTTDKIICQELVNLLVSHGIKDIILSPGTRNAPLIIAVTRNENLRSHVVIDERSAAFVALGISLQSQKPVAIICTSGTAMLNYAPALAEAFYREAPIIVITADRPNEWIDQDDCQTIHQFQAYGKLVKQSVNVSDDSSEKSLWLANRQINDAIVCATSGRLGPVHINVQLDAPLTQMIERENMFSRHIDCIMPEPLVATSVARNLAAMLKSPKKVMIIVGYNTPNQKLNKALKKLSQHANIVTIAEAQSNIHFNKCIYNIESIFSIIDLEKLSILQPDIVITLGGSILSKSLKKWLRELPDVRHWHVGVRGLSTDCFKHLERRIEVPAETFMLQLASGMVPFMDLTSDYAMQWQKLSNMAKQAHAEFVCKAQWCDLVAIDKIVSMLPVKCNLQISNGTAVRYVQLCEFTHLHRIDCNRGVSGIDGSTSTAVGAAMAYDGTTVLLTGDMSAQYDIGALAIHNFPKNLKIIVIDNEGGTIFRLIKPTCQLPECEDYFAAHVHFPARQLANGFGFDYYEASDIDSLVMNLKIMLNDTTKPAIFVVHTSGNESADVFRKYMTQFKTKNINN